MIFRLTKYLAKVLEHMIFFLSEPNKEDGMDIFIPMEPLHFLGLAQDS